MSDTAQTLSLLLECPICLGPFTDPRLLTRCFHTLCYKCLNDHIGQSGQGGRFQCPICRRSLEIPNGRADDFPRNYFANSCLDVLADSATGEREPAAGCDQGQVGDKVCSNSEEGDECAEAVQFCLDCCDKYCQQCSKVHRKTRATSKHKQVALDELSDDMLNEAMSKLETPSCPKHQGKSLELYCSTCQCAVCSICCHIDHQSHTFKEMKDVDEGLKAELDPLVITVEVLKESVKCQIREVDKTTEVYKKNASKARESVKGLFQQMQQMLIQKASEIDQVICRKYDEAEALANSRSKNLVLNGQFLESLSSFAQNLQRKGSVFNRLASLPEVRLQVEKLKQSVDNMLSVPEVPSHTELFAESVDNLMIETDIELDPHNPEETRKIKVLQTSKIYSESVTGNDQGQTADAAGAGKIGGYIGQETLSLVSNLFFKETRHPNVIQTQNIRVTLRKGSIESEQAAVVVNPLDRDLDLKKTATSRALLKAAGGQLEDEFRSNVEKSEIKPGSIIETKGWNLSSRAVYHGVLVEWNAASGQAKQVMQKLLQECFQTAENHRIPSIALPPAGTGKLGYPTEEVAQIMLAEIASFSSRQPVHLTDIHIIVHPKDVKKQEIFERVFRSAVGKTEPSQRGNGTHVDRDTSSSFGSAGDGDENKFKVGSISLIIKTGDITRERTDAIVNSSNPKLDLSRGAVQRAIARAGGDAVEKDCREKTVRNGIAVTTAGKMDAKKIIHLAPSSKDRDGLLWQKLVKRTLDEAEHLGLKTVAFPAVGTGSGHQDVRDVAKSMVEGLAYFEKNTKPKTVKVVTFTIFQHEMVDTFKDAAKRFSQGRGQKGRSPVGSASVESGALAREIELQIYALSGAIIRDVEREIAKYAEESMITGEVGDSSIKKLTDKQKQDIRAFASSRGVEVDFETKTLGFGRNSASIRGHADDFMLVKDHISKILKEIQKAKHEKETGKVMSRQVQWEFQDPC